MNREKINAAVEKIIADELDAQKATSTAKDLQDLYFKISSKLSELAATDTDVIDDAILRDIEKSLVSARMHIDQGYTKLANTTLSQVI